ncbi:hypothetical protein [uncultured Erythrobacter sp.]|uniref:hypothetical protein n=1 Tax=uncultured Erythrobacter sp. TaxID=263913 RepID=UPI002604655B|nr:hypothetical protein [uncultured Erythrobacter sp.]
MRNLAIAGGLILAAAVPASAQSQSCEGFLTGSYIYDEGSAVVNTDWSPTWFQICNVKTTWKGITPDICLSWLAKVDAAVTHGKNVRFYYQGNKISACNQIPSYVDAPAPNYVMLLPQDRP